MKSMCKHWGLHISTDTDRLEVFLGSFWAVWRGLLMSLEPKLRSWRFLRYWRFNKRYHGGYQLICLISWPILISSRRDWYRSKRSLQGLSVAIETVRIIKELVEIWLNEVCDRVFCSNRPYRNQETYNKIIHCNNRTTDWTSKMDCII